MGMTIPGGAYKDAAGAWHDANGKLLNDKQIASFERLSTARQSEPDVSGMPSSQPVAKVSSKKAGE